MTSTEKFVDLKIETVPVEYLRLKDFRDILYHMCDHEYCTNDGVDLCSDHISKQVWINTIASLIRLCEQIPFDADDYDSSDGDSESESESDDKDQTSDRKHLFIPRSIGKFSYSSFLTRLYAIDGWEGAIDKLGGPSHILTGIVRCYHDQSTSNEILEKMYCELRETCFLPFKRFEASYTANKVYKTHLDQLEKVYTRRKEKAILEKSITSIESQLAELRVQLNELK